VKVVPQAWLDLIKSDPLFVISTHLRRNSYLIPIPFFGLPSPPFLHSQIDQSYLNLHWAFPFFAEKARVLLRGWNYLRMVTAWAGIWLISTLTLYRSRIQKNHQAISTMVLSSIIILLVFAPIPDARYALIILILGQLAFGSLVIRKLSSRLKT